ncbi:AAA family ATPase [Streptomyces alanosinicus]|uniref:ORC1/DEAH AAA+ ATPase domain-containing protein n=1 Tax=Streptomyces alanosinicus TaxID=68171 RepID=A0A918YSE2_9ACTN|nr:AAA family ATPase [Streptomyces alanosinicus]GHE12059.1 hypothetical protein GCM10010339_74050 [Streptomyces alanosinicus]
MNETVPDEAAAALCENLGHVLQACALMCVIAPDSVQGETVVQAALQHAQAEPVIVTGTAPGTLPALLASLHDQLAPTATRPRQAAQLQDTIEAELVRRPRPAVVVHDAHLLRSDALYYLYRLWDAFQEHEPRLPVILTGPEKLQAVLDRPQLASLKSCVYLWHRLN